MCIEWFCSIVSNHFRGLGIDAGGQKAVVGWLNRNDVTLVQFLLLFIDDYFSLQLYGTTAQLFIDAKFFKRVHNALLIFLSTSAAIPGRVRPCSAGLSMSMIIEARSEIGIPRAAPSWRLHLCSRD